MIVRDIINLLDKHWPFGLALSWDNSGLQCGNPGREVTGFVLAVDLTPAVVDKALQTGANLIITHHPHIFKPLSKITDPLLLKMLENKVACLAAHTNFDVAPDGVNHALAECLGLQVEGLLTRENGAQRFHLAVYVPPAEREAVAVAAFAAGAGVIGHYSHCSSRLETIGSFIPEEGSHPLVGQVGRLEEVDEERFECLVDSYRLDAVLQAIRAAHPYEEPVYAVYRLEDAPSTAGLGLMTTLPQPVTLEQLARLVKDKLRAPGLVVWPNGSSYDKVVKKVAICGGSGQSVLGAAVKADAFITGELGHHQALGAGLPVLLAGHAHSEFPALNKIAAVLQPLALPLEIVFPENYCRYF